MPRIYAPNLHVCLALSAWNLYRAFYLLPHPHARIITNSVWYRYVAGALPLTSFFFHFVLYRCPSMSVTMDIVVVVPCQVLVTCPFLALLVVWLRPDWLTPVIQRQSAVPATSIISADVSVAGTFTLLIKIPAMVTFYRATLCCLPGIISLIIMCIGIIFR